MIRVIDRKVFIPPTDLYFGTKGDTGVEKRVIFKSVPTGDSGNDKVYALLQYNLINESNGREETKSVLYELSDTESAYEMVFNASIPSNLNMEKPYGNIQFMVCANIPENDTDGTDDYIWQSEIAHFYVGESIADNNDLSDFQTVISPALAQYLAIYDVINRKTEQTDFQALSADVEGLSSHVSGLTTIKHITEDELNSEKSLEENTAYIVYPETDGMWLGGEEPATYVVFTLDSIQIKINAYSFDKGIFARWAYFNEDSGEAPRFGEWVGIYNEEFEMIYATIDGKSDNDHLHDTRYYTKEIINERLEEKAEADNVSALDLQLTEHLEGENPHGITPTRIGSYTKGEVDSKLQTKSNANHNHDVRYYTESEIDTRLNEKSDTDHFHETAVADIGDIVGIPIICRDYETSQSDTIYSEYQYISETESYIVFPNTSYYSTAELFDTGDRVSIKIIPDRDSGIYYVSINGIKNIMMGEYTIPETTLEGPIIIKTEFGLGYKVQIISSRQGKNGFMSSLDKKKLDSIEYGADKTVTDKVLSLHSDKPISNKTVTGALNGKASANHTHTASDVGAYTKEEVNAKLQSKSNSNHNHDGRYYTEDEVDELLSDKLDKDGGTVEGDLSVLGSISSSANIGAMGMSVASGVDESSDDMAVVNKVSMVNYVATHGGQTGIISLTNMGSDGIQEAVSIPANKEVRFTVTNNTSFELQAGVGGVANEWVIVVSMGDTPWDIVLPIIHWGAGISPTFLANTTTMCRLYYIGDVLCGEWVCV